jgi:hypothetical protein
MFTWPCTQSGYSERKQNYLLGIIYIQIFQQQNALIDEQKFNDRNPLYTLASVTRQHVMQSSIHHNSVLTTQTRRQYQRRVSPSYIIIQPLCLHYIETQTSTIF